MAFLIWKESTAVNPCLVGGTNHPDAAPDTFDAKIIESLGVVFNHSPTIYSVTPCISALGGTGYSSAVSKKLIPSS